MSLIIDALHFDNPTITVLMEVTSKSKPKPKSQTKAIDDKQQSQWDQLVMALIRPPRHQYNPNQLSNKSLTKAREFNVEDIQRSTSAKTFRYHMNHKASLSQSINHPNILEFSSCTCMGIHLRSSKQWDSYNSYLRASH
jgi:hypothetical protein